MSQATHYFINQRHTLFKFYTSSWGEVCRARTLTDEQRSAVANYFAVYKGQEKGLARLAVAFHDHPVVERAYSILKPIWLEVGCPYLLFDMPGMQPLFAWTFLPLTCNQ